MNEGKEFPDAATLKITLEKATRRSWRDFAKERIGDTKRIPLGEKFLTLSKEERKAIEKIFEKEIVLCHAIFGDWGSGNGTARVLDAAYWIKGCSSLGKLRYAVLLEVERDGSRQADRRLMDIKEAVEVVAPASHGVRMPRVNGERVVEDTRHLSPYLAACRT